MLLETFMSKYLSSQELIKQDTQNGMKLLNVNLDQMQVFVMVNNVGINMNADASVKS